MTSIAGVWIIFNPCPRIFKGAHQARVSIIKINLKLKQGSFSFRKFRKKKSKTKSKQKVTKKK